jgi:hypothetical protein
MRFDEFWVSDKGIYTTRNVYHDDIEYIFYVEFDSPDRGKQFKDFLELIRRQGEQRNLSKLKQEFKTLRSIIE